MAAAPNLFAAGAERLAYGLARNLTVSRNRLLGCPIRSIPLNITGSKRGQTANAALAEALVAANYREANVRPHRRLAPNLPLFAAE
ncbi:hypothetical protein [Methylobacterium nonmethylotrophicum]|uniref:Uncharacterized protein n=1 Tax=Methylobacterium nonmethylotrophicum TaxID=1141884 RepID=A0A4Z0NPM5_9HYPH|nr:hypothetical protein [Methylobacterium nonmethylotrophicum]TGD98071.1 hypothetical protein EU555_18160 [Methylobacterium nonmethylotrophicum]